MRAKIAWAKVTTGLSGPLLVISSLGVHAAPPVVPGAGTILQEAEPVPPPAPSSNSTGLFIQSNQGPEVPQSAPFEVKKIHISGNTVFDEPTLHALVAGSEGKDLTLPQLHEVTARISDYYHSHGYPLTRAIVPAQTIRDGMVSITVIEARYDTISIENHSSVRDSLVRATLSPLQAGQLITQTSLDHALLLLSDIPGMLTSATLKPGGSVGTSNLLVDTAKGPWVTGTAALDDYGNRYTGDARLGGTVNLIDPLHQADVLSANALTAGSGMSYGRLGYEALLNGLGTRAGAAYSALHYTLGDSLEALDGHGTARVGSLWVKQPLVRTTNVNLYGQVQFDHKELHDDLNASEIHTDRHLNEWTASLAGDCRDRLFGGGVNSWNVAGTAGQLGFDDAGAQSADAATARTRGRFSRWSASLDRVQSLGPRGALYVAISAQWASANLDASEKLVAGGPYGVRAYGTGALSGDSGYVGTVEYRRDLGAAAAGRWQAIAFVDSEHLTVNRNTWTPEINTARLSGAGVGLNFTAGARWYATIDLAAPFGSTPALVGATKSAQLWSQIGLNF
jgi:hemolysin activation/secretion protein